MAGEANRQIVEELTESGEGTGLEAEGPAGGAPGPAGKPAAKGGPAAPLASDAAPAAGEGGDASAAQAAATPPATSAPAASAPAASAGQAPGTPLQAPAPAPVPASASAAPAAPAAPLDPESIEIQTRPLTVAAALARIAAGTLDIDPLVRALGAAWDEGRESRLIESLLLKIPVPALYAVEDAAENWAIVDGVRRLLAIARFVDAGALGAESFALTGLDYLGADFAGKGFAALPPRLQRRLKEAELVVHVVRHGTPDAVKRNIAARLNPPVATLSRQEFRHVTTIGPARATLAAWADSDSFKAATANSIRSVRMLDRELVLRFAAFRLTPWQDYEGDDIGAFLDEAMRRLNRVEGEELAALTAAFEAAMTSAASIFGEDAFRRRYDADHDRMPVNRALFETVAVALAARDDEERATLSAKNSEVKDSFMNLMHQREFDDAISRGAGDAESVRTRFRLIDELLGQVHACSTPSD